MRRRAAEPAAEEPAPEPAAAEPGRAAGEHDVVVVGGRVAGAGTALLLARAGWRVLVVERARRGTDTLSTHALLRPAVLQLERWGVLDEVVAAGTPGQDRVVFHYGDAPTVVDVSRRLYAPRRTVLDAALVAVAERAGAGVRFGVSARGLLRSRSGRVVGVRTVDGSGATGEVRSRVVVGADGRSSAIARDVDAPVTSCGAAATAFLYGYWSDVEAAGYEWCFRPGATAGLIPTNDGRTCVFVGTSRRRLSQVGRPGLEELLGHVLAGWPGVAERVAAGSLSEHVRAFPGLPGVIRRPWGPGWALVGDAGYYKDPSTAHGISDALRDAELLAHAIDRVLREEASESSALSQYEQTRDALSLPLFAVTNAVANLRWTLPEVQRLHLDMSDAMQREVDVLSALEPLGVAPAAA